MARIRTIKPSFWADQDVGQLSRDARLCLIALISFADDEGRFIAIPAAIIGYAYPYDRITHSRLQAWVDEIAKHGIIAIYEHDGAYFGHFPKWGQHQRINRPTPSAIPPPNQ